MKKSKKTRRSTKGLTTLDQFLKDEGKLEEFEAVAIKEVLAWQIAEAMKLQNLSRKRLAERMKTSRSQIGRLLDPKDGNVTITTLQRAAKIVGRTLRLACESQGAEADLTIAAPGARLSFRSAQETPIP
jgi:antitoxin HicB